MTEPSAENFKSLADMRLQDANVLLADGRHSASFYLAGYAVECGIKAIVALSFRAGVIPDKKFVDSVYTHNLSKLVSVADLDVELRLKLKASDMFRSNWSIVGTWNEASRYEIIDPFRAADFVQAVGDAEAGVLPWLKTHW